MAGGGTASAAGEGAGAKGVSLAREVSQVVNMAAFKAAFKRKGREGRLIKSQRWSEGDAGQGFTPHIQSNDP
eukprot:scaffold3712_cov152-Isochrysis_galbana.AAC.1